VTLTAEQVVDVFERVLREIRPDVGHLTADTELHTLGISSVDLVEIWYEMECTAGMPLDPQTVYQPVVIGDLAAAQEDRDSGAAPGGSAPR
jgi:acyl carrier protein